MRGRKRIFAGLVASRQGMSYMFILPVKRCSPLRWSRVNACTCRRPRTVQVDIVHT
jgi:hypothetical protein